MKKFSFKITLIIVAVVIFIGYSLHLQKVKHDEQGSAYRQMIQDTETMGSAKYTVYVKGINQKQMKSSKTPTNGERIFLDKTDINKIDSGIVRAQAQCAVQLAKDEPSYISQDSVGQYIWCNEYTAIYLTRKGSQTNTTPTNNTNSTNSTNSTSNTNSIDNATYNPITEDQAITKLKNMGYDQMEVKEKGQLSSNVLPVATNRLYEHDSYLIGGIGGNGILFIADAYTGIIYQNTQDSNGKLIQLK